MMCVGCVRNLLRAGVDDGDGPLPDGDADDVRSRPGSQLIQLERQLLNLRGQRVSLSGHGSQARRHFRHIHVETKNLFVSCAAVPRGCQGSVSWWMGRHVLLSGRSERNNTIAVKRLQSVVIVAFRSLHFHYLHNLGERNKYMFISSSTQDADAAPPKLGPES